jgi:hypothetical protein
MQIDLPLALESQIILHHIYENSNPHPQSCLG